MTSKSSSPNYMKLPSDQAQVGTGIFPYANKAPAGAFSEGAHDNLIRSFGFKAIHYKFALSARRESIEGGTRINDTLKYDTFTFYDAAPVFVDFQQMTWTDLYVQQGIYGNSQVAVMNYCSTYEDEAKKRVFLRNNDILVADNDLSVLTEQIVDWNGKTSQRFNFPILEVDYLASASTRFYPNTDFTVIEGCLSWLDGGAKPSKLGEVLSIVYWTKPYYQVIATPRATRALYTNTFGNPNEPKKLTYFPGSAVVRMMWSAQINFDLPDWNNPDAPPTKGNLR